MIEAVNGYLNTVDTLKMLFILCDSVRPLPDDEKNLIDTCLVKNIQPVVLRTKTDKLNQREMATLKKETIELTEEFEGLFVIHSSVKNESSIHNMRDLLKTL